MITLPLTDDPDLVRAFWHVARHVRDCGYSPSIAATASATGLSVGRVWRLLGDLKRRGYLHAQPFTGGRLGLGGRARFVGEAA